MAYVSIAKVGLLVIAVIGPATCDVSLVLATGKLQRDGKEEDECNLDLDDTDRFSEVGYVMLMLRLY